MGSKDNGFLLRRMNVENQFRQNINFDPIDESEGERPAVLRTEKRILKGLEDFGWVVDGVKHQGLFAIMVLICTFLLLLAIAVGGSYFFGKLKTKCVDSRTRMLTLTRKKRHCGWNNAILSGNYSFIAHNRDFVLVG